MIVIIFWMGISYIKPYIFCNNFVLWVTASNNLYYNYFENLSTFFAQCWIFFFCISKLVLFSWTDLVLLNRVPLFNIANILSAGHLMLSVYFLISSLLSLALFRVIRVEWKPIHTATFQQYHLKKMFLQIAPAIWKSSGGRFKCWQGGNYL